MARSCAGAAARGDQRGAHAHGGRAVALQPCSAASSGLKGRAAAAWMRPFPSRALEGAQPVALEDPLGLVAEQHGVAVEGDAHLVRGGPRLARADCG
jgi:hypothetical protein